MRVICEESIDRIATMAIDAEARGVESMTAPTLNGLPITRDDLEAINARIRERGGRCLFVADYSEHVSAN